MSPPTTGDHKDRTLRNHRPNLTLPKPLAKNIIQVRTGPKLCFDGCVTGYLGNLKEALVSTIRGTYMVLAFGNAYPCHSSIVGIVGVFGAPIYGWAENNASLSNRGLCISVDDFYCH